MGPLQSGPSEIFLKSTLSYSKHRLNFCVEEGLAEMWTTLRFRAAPNMQLHRIHRVTQLQFKAFDTKSVGAAKRAKV